MKTRKAYKFRIFPTRRQETKLDATLRLCRELYNAALTERREAYRMVGKSLNYYDQANQLPEIKEERTDLKEVHSQVLQDVLKRVDKAFGGFFSRAKLGKKAGFPRFKGNSGTKVSPIPRAVGLSRTINLPFPKSALSE